MIEYLSLCSSPNAETCVGVGGMTADQKAECRRYIELLHKLFPDCAEKGVSLVTKREDHEAGTYYEVNASYRDDDEEAEDYANFIQSNLPEKWTDTQVLKMETK